MPTWHHSEDALSFFSKPISQEIIILSRTPWTEFAWSRVQPAIKYMMLFPFNKLTAEYTSLIGKIQHDEMMKLDGKP